MGWRFRRSVKILPGVKVNFGAKSASVTVGGRLARKTYSTTGRQTTSYSVPGTGLYYTTSTGGRAKRSERRSAPPPKPPFYRRTWFIVLMLILLPPAGIALMWLYRREWRMPVKIVVTALSLLWFIALLTPKPATDPQQPASSPMAAATSAPTASPTAAPTSAPAQAGTDQEAIYVWIPTNGGNKYHSYSGCSNMDAPQRVTETEEKGMGYTPCQRCH